MQILSKPCRVGSRFYARNHARDVASVTSSADHVNASRCSAAVSSLLWERVGGQSTSSYGSATSRRSYGSATSTRRYGSQSQRRFSSMGGSKVPLSISASQTVNPIRRVVERIKAKPNPDLEMIPLSIGDPTVFGNFGPPDHLAKTLSEKMIEGKSNGYGHSTGLLEAREAIACRFSALPPAISPDIAKPLTAEDVIITSGCSHALDLAIQVIANPGEHNILLPKPGFPLYQTLASSRGIDCKFYNLLPDKSWDVDLVDLEAQIDSKTACIMINSPSNPCGNVFSRSHIEEICKVAERHNLPLIADEIYANMAFPGKRDFVATGEVSVNVPFLSVGGLAKQYMIPGWRMGWLTINDRHNRLADIKTGLADLSTLILGPSTLQQACLAPLLQDTPEEYYTGVMQQLSDNADVIVESLTDCPGLRVIQPQGAMYVLIEILDKSYDDTTFTNELLKQQAVFVLPGQCFGVKNFFRVVISPPKDKLVEACKRIRTFCEKKWVQDKIL